MGRVSNQRVLILIDGGSTQNFIQERLIPTLGLTAQPTQPLQVIVGNGNELDCLRLCGNIAVHVQGNVFTMISMFFP